MLPPLPSYRTLTPWRGTPALHLWPRRDVTDGWEWKLCTQVGLHRTGLHTWGRGKDHEEGSKLDLPWLKDCSQDVLCFPSQIPQWAGGWSTAHDAAGVLWKAVVCGVTRVTASQGPLWEPLLRVPEQAVGHSTLVPPLRLSVKGEHKGLHPPPTVHAKV